MDKKQTAAVTIGVLGVLTALMLVIGVKWATQPLPSAGFGAGESSMCEWRTVSAGSRVRPADVVVSVYNSSKRTGLASKTMSSLMDRGFGRGSSGNVDAPDVPKVEVWASSANDPAAQLVATHFGSHVPINTSHPEVADSVVVVLGPDYTRLARNPAEFAVAEHDTEICSPRLDADPDADPELDPEADPAATEE
ncbi:LytR C-terminal domain-containing protein [Nocardioides sp. AE5]|uniref:LytR C-terminal domain-containing protein n=1 Tax=Nocardioides sp. AE5 TaxID=2962573 RepID=UPI0028823630|nr:LytR C-terminal domain-containing protein [Nocardioides sp. AE5]MDT0200495.1 LytR C-terminal domain-containing protein [Nocardioides sp. AE5]